VSNVDDLGIDRDALVAVFLAETEEGLTAMDESLVRLETAPGDEEVLNRIFRVAHTLKGNAATLGLAAPADFAHHLEDLLDRVRARTLAVTSPLISLLLEAADALRVLVPAAAAGEDELRPEQKVLLERLERFVLGAPAEEPAASAASAQPSVPSQAKTLRVDVAKLDRMLNLSGEISISRGRLSALLEAGTEADGADVVDALRELDALFLDLQEQITKVRMVPVGPTFRRFVRTVRDVAAAHGKEAHLVVDGEDVEVDMSIIEMIRDPLTHLIRNALDHGIESPEVRAAHGKPRSGCITLRARHEAGRIVLQVSDDGAGLSRERILARARAIGRVADGERLGDADVYRLIFEPGFSTAAAVTDMSGRGIGLDVVRRNVDALRGTVSVEGREGRGATITIRLPLTLAIIRGFLVGVAGQTYVVPLESVSECVDGSIAGASAEVSGVLSLRGEAIPYLRLRRSFALEGPPGERECVVVLRSGEARSGLVVDALLGECEAVIKPLGRLLPGLPGIASATILASGHVALILDIATLLEEAASRARQAAEGSTEIAS
jgi:two-component system chemotaxis sensor kinase CheA